MPSRSSHPLSRGYAPAWASAWGQDEYGPCYAFRVGDVEQCFRWIPPGLFLMGSPDDDSERLDREEPPHQVRLTQGFWLFDTPCRQALWQAVMDENPSRFEGANRPVENVSWDDCQAFISKLNAQIPGLELGLPTESQWEYACRADTPGSRYDADIDVIAWYNANSSNETHDVAQKRANAWGLYDMLGNVYEWVGDWYGEYTADAVTDPSGPESGADRVIRGGSWDDPARDVRAAYRYWDEPGLRGSDFGFRCLSSGREPRRASTAGNDLSKHPTHRALTQK